MGWSDIKSKDAEKVIETNRYNELCHAVFESTPLGKELLNYMVKNFIVEQRINPAMPTSVSYFNQGRQDLIKEFIANIRFFKTKELNT